MKISQVFPSKYVAAEDLQGRDISLTIASVTLEEMTSHDNQKANKPVVYFEKATKGLVLNRTNANIIADLYSDETDTWTGKRVTIYATRVKAFGKVVPAIRVRETVPAAPKAAPVHVPVEEPSIDDAEDLIDADTDRERKGESRESVKKDNNFSHSQKRNKNKITKPEIKTYICSIISNLKSY
jgi:hypothetical protein